MKYGLKLTLLSALLILPAHRAAGEIIRLRNGVELHCEILEYSEERGLKVKRLDNGGIFELRWDHILDEDVRTLKEALGYSEENAQPILIRAKRIWFRNGNFEDGLLIDSDRPGAVCLLRGGQKYYFSQDMIEDIQAVEVEARDIYTLEELYQRKVEEIQPREPVDYFNLGVYCESLTYYDKALELFKKVQEIESGYKEAVVAQKIRLMETKLLESDATRLLDEVKQQIYRRKYVLAEEKILQFEERFPQSVQMGLKEKLKSQLFVERKAFYQQKILTDFFTYMDRAAGKAAADREVSLDGAIEFASGGMGEVIRNKLAVDIYEIPRAEVDELWRTRKGGGHRTASYGTGTFILGPERAKVLPEGEAAGAAAEEAEEKAAAGATLDERLKKTISEIMKKQKARDQKKKTSFALMEEVGRTPEEWWETESLTNRKRFLIAYYAEFSGDMKVERVRFNPCPNCNGQGWLEQYAAMGQEDEKFPCEVCKGLGVERVVVFR